MRPGREAATAASAAVCAVVCVTAAVGGWLQHRPDLDRDDARRFTLAALRHAGLPDVKVGKVVLAGTFPARPGGTPVWITTAAVGGGTLRFSIDRAAAQALFVEESPSSGSRVLDDAQFAALDRYTSDPALRRRLRRNVAASAAGAAGAVAAALVVSQARPGVVRRGGRPRQPA